MSSLVDTLATFGTWNWLFAAAILMGLEFIVPGVHFIWFGLAAALTGFAIFALTALGAGDAMTLPWQLLMFSGLAVVSLFLVKSWGVSASRGRTDNPSLNVRGAQYIGREVKVEDAIINGRGRVRVDDGVWGAEGEDAPRGAEVRVTGVNGTVLVVENALDD